MNHLRPLSTHLACADYRCAAAATCGDQNSQSDEYTALIWAAVRGRTECVRALLDAGADKEATDKVCRRCIFVACLPSLFQTLCPFSKISSSLFLVSIVSLPLRFFNSSDCRAEKRRWCVPLRCPGRHACGCCWMRAPTRMPRTRCVFRTRS